MSSSSPVISVVMPVYNAEKYLNEAIDSILLQTFKEFEFIIINDGSSDKSLDIIQSYNDNRIILIDKKNTGLADSLNNGIIKSRGEYIARMDADDISYSHRFTQQVDFLENNLEVIAVGSNADIIDKDSNYVYKTILPLNSISMKEELPYNTPFIHPSIMMRKKILIKAGLYPNIPVAQDLFLFNRIAAYGNFANIKNTLIQYRLTPSASTRRTVKTQKIIKSILDDFLINNKITITQIEKINYSIQNTLKEEKIFQYYLLVAKKYLWNNYEPKLARLNIIKALQYNKFDPIVYMLLVLSYFPKCLINIIYRYHKKLK